jgi:DNA-binding beta-propeller fold protein YncE
VIRRIGLDGSVERVAGSSIGAAGEAGGDALTEARFNNPNGVAVNADGTTIWVADSGNHRIRVVSGGLVMTLAGTSQGFDDGNPAQFNNPTGIVLDPTTGDVYVV